MEELSDEFIVYLGERWFLLFILLFSFLNTTSFFFKRNQLKKLINNDYIIIIIAHIKECVGSIDEASKLYSTIISSHYESPLYLGYLLDRYRYRSHIDSYHLLRFWRICEMIDWYFSTLKTTYLINYLESVFYSAIILKVKGSLNQSMEYLGLLFRKERWLKEEKMIELRSNDVGQIKLRQRYLSSSLSLFSYISHSFIFFWKIRICNNNLKWFIFIKFIYQLSLPFHPFSCSTLFV